MVFRAPRHRKRSAAEGWASYSCWDESFVRAPLAFAPGVGEGYFSLRRKSLRRAALGVRCRRSCGRTIVLGYDQRIGRRKLSSFSALLYAACRHRASRMVTFVGFERDFRDCGCGPDDDLYVGQLDSPRNGSGSNSRTNRQPFHARDAGWDVLGEPADGLFRSLFRNPLRSLLMAFCRVCTTWMYQIWGYARRKWIRMSLWRWLASSIHTLLMIGLCGCAHSYFTRRKLQVRERFMEKEAGLSIPSHQKGPES